MAPATTSTRSEPARALADGSLGARLIRMARLAAAVHMAESALPRKDPAQTVPAGKAGAR
jgi:hypothetical protein